MTQERSDAPKNAERAATSTRHEADEDITLALGAGGNAASSREGGASDDDGEASSADSESEKAAPVRGLVATDSGGQSGTEQDLDYEEDSAASSRDSDSEGSEAVGKGVRSAARPDPAAEPYEEVSSSGWSSGDEEDEGEEQINDLARSMLAALHSVDSGRASGSGARSDAQRTHVSSGAQCSWFQNFLRPQSCADAISCAVF